VLIVEDNADVRDMLRVLLEVGGHEVHEAEDGPTGLQTALAARPDVAFIDIGLPSMDGDELVQHIRTQTEGPAADSRRAHRLWPFQGPAADGGGWVPRTPHQAGPTQTASARSCTVRRIAVIHRTSAGG
jgi:Response regulator receiver domain